MVVSSVERRNRRECLVETGLEVGGPGHLKFIVRVTASEQDSLRQFSELDFED